MLLALTQQLGSSFDLVKTLECVESGLRSLIPHEAMAIFILQGDTLVMRHAAGECKEMLSAEVRSGEGLVGWVAQHQQPIVNGNPAVESGFQGGVGNGLQSAIALALKGSSGLVGVLAYYRRERDSFNADHVRILTGVAPRIATAIENSLKVREIEERANMDLTTGLPTMRGMLEALDLELVRAKRQKQPLAVLVVEFSGVSSLKLDADADGGLRKAARFLKGICREYDHVARIGADTFSMILPGMRDKTLGLKIKKLHAMVSRGFPPSIENGTIRFNAGAALYPDDADTSKLLLAIAEGRVGRGIGGSTESLLALQEHNRKESESSPTEEARLEGEASGELPAKERGESFTGRQRK